MVEEGEPHRNCRRHDRRQRERGRVEAARQEEEAGYEAEAGLHEAFHKYVEAGRENAEAVADVEPAARTHAVLNQGPERAFREDQAPE